MKQYCRYCAYCIVQLEGFAWCEELSKEMSETTAKSVNTCKRFEFNEIDAFDLDKKYKPREKKEKVEDTSPTLFD